MGVVLKLLTIRRLLGSATRRVRSDEAGVSLVEVLVASFLLAVVLFALAAVTLQSIGSVRVSRDRDLAATAASAALEVSRDLGLGTLALSTANDFSGDANISAGKFAHDGVNFEDLVLSSSGLSPYRCTPAAPPADCWFPYESYSTVHSVSLYVTWYDDDVDVDVDGDGVKNNDRDAKRATVEVIWEDQGQTKTVRQSTIIAESKRGLGTPEFLVSPLDVGTLLAPGEPGCFFHEVTNVGAPSKFDLTIPNPDDGTLPPATGDYLTVSYKGPSSNVHSLKARAWLGDTAVDDAKAWLVDSTQPATPASMIDADSDPRLESGMVDKDETAPLAICYEFGSNPPSDFQLVIEPLVRSELGVLVGEDEPQRLSHTIRVATTAAALYLAPPPDGSTTTLTGTFSTDIPTTSTLPDFDSDGLPGLGLLKPSNNGGVGERATWGTSSGDAQAASFTKARLVVWTHWDDGIKFGTTPTAVDLAFTVRLCITDANATSCGTNGASRSVAYTHASAGWCQHGSSTDCPTAITFDFGSEQSVGSNQQLLLELTCTSGTRDKDEDCHFAYGANSFAARLDLS